MNHWIFQGNPDIFMVDQYVRDNDQITWTINQKHLATEMESGDEVFLWRAAGRSKAIAGIIGRGILTDRPREMEIDQTEIPLWIAQPPSGKELMATIKLLEKCLRPKEVVKRSWLGEDPVAGGIRILKLASETNYRIGRNEAERMAELVRNTGRDWNREESIAGLWAYAHTRGQAVSRRLGSPVSEVAMTIGRAITGVYNKVMNFRAIDPADPRAGLSAGGQVDQAVWDEFYDAGKGQINMSSLDQEFARLWGRPQTPHSVKSRPSYKDFGDAPDDDPEDLREFARRVRRGQKAFRDNLLAAYGEKCCISGHGPKEVLEAVHIVEHAKSGINKLDNGLLMRADVHALFDDCLIRINPDNLLIETDASLELTPYARFKDKKLETRIDGSQIGKKYLRMRWDSIGG